MKIKLRNYGVVALLFLSGPIVSQSVLPGTDSVFTEHFGQKVFHPYAWLKSTDTRATRNWLDRQKVFKDKYFSPADFKRMNHRYSYDLSGYGRQTNFHLTTLEFRSEKPPKLFLNSELHDLERILLIDCSELKRNQYDFPSIEEYWVTDRYHLLIAAISHSGSDWLEFMVYDLHTLSLKYSIKGIIREWLRFHDDGFYYEKYDEPEDETKAIRLNERISFHKFDTGPEEDKTIFQNQDPSSIRIFSFYEKKESDRIYLFHPFKLKNDWGEAIA